MLCGNSSNSSMGNNNDSNNNNNNGNDESMSAGNWKNFLNTNNYYRKVNIT